MAAVARKATSLVLAGRSVVLCLAVVDVDSVFRGQRRSETADESACYCPVFASFITSLLNANPQRRMTAEQARRHPWLLGQCCEDDRLVRGREFKLVRLGHRVGFRLPLSPSSPCREVTVAIPPALTDCRKKHMRVGRRLGKCWTPDTTWVRPFDMLQCKVDHPGLSRLSKLVLHVLADLDCDSRRESPRRRAELA